MDLLELVLQYRLIRAKSKAGVGLSWDDIELLTRIESRFATDSFDERSFRREPVALAATLRLEGERDAVSIVEMSPGGLVCEQAPFCQPGDRVEIVVDLDTPAASASARASTSPLPERGRSSVRRISELASSAATRIPPVRSIRFAAVVMWALERSDDTFSIGVAFHGVPVVVTTATGAREAEAVAQAA